MGKVVKALNGILVLVCVLIFIWIVLSFAEINMQNLTENPVYNNYNFFVVIIRLKNNLE